MILEYERDLSGMKLIALKGVAQDEAVLILAKRLGISRQEMRKILIAKCDLMTLENLSNRIAYAQVCDSDKLAYKLSLPHLTTATGILDEDLAKEILEEAKGKISRGGDFDAVANETIKNISEIIK